MTTLVTFGLLACAATVGFCREYPPHSPNQRHVPSHMRSVSSVYPTAHRGTGYSQRYTEAKMFAPVMSRRSYRRNVPQSSYNRKSEIMLPEMMSTDSALPEVPAMTAPEVPPMTAAEVPAMTAPGPMEPAVPGATVPEVPIAILSQTQEDDFNGTFNYSFEAENGISVQLMGHPKVLSTGEVVQTMEGEYKYTAPDGTPITTKWFADETGFHADGAHIPGSSANV